MNYCNIFLLACALLYAPLSAVEFTIASYNCGGLSAHYDYWRAATMQKLMQERYSMEPANMALNENIQRLALKILFAENQHEKEMAQQEWDSKGYHEASEFLTSPPTSPRSPNTLWYQKAEAMISSYQIRPVSVKDTEVFSLVKEHLHDLTRGKNGTVLMLLQETRAIMAQRLLEHQLKFDILCLQEADYLEESMFPANYEVAFGSSAHSVNGVAWNKERFTLVETLGDIVGRGYAVRLFDKESQQYLVVATGHLSGCNPYHIETNAFGKSDSAKGDGELQTIVDVAGSHDADLMVIGMDSNVTSLHPRLQILKEAGYRLDYENFIEPTCSNPYQVLQTRIDWIAAKSKDNSSVTIVNIPVLNIGLNSVETNISDHKPIAAKISY